MFLMLQTRFALFSKTHLTFVDELSMYHPFPLAYYPNDCYKETDEIVVLHRFSIICFEKSYGCRRLVVTIKVNGNAMTKVQSSI